MELKQVFFEKRTRISGSAQRLSGYTFIGVFLIMAIVFLILPFTESNLNMETIMIFIGAVVVLLGLAYIAYRSTIRLKRVEADEEKIYVQNSKADIEEVYYSQITGARRTWTLVTREFNIKLFYLNDDGIQQTIRFAPRIFGNHYDNFVDLLSQKNPNLKIRRRNY